MDIIRVIDDDGCNLSNILEYRPFEQVDSVIVFDSFWWNQLTLNQQRNIESAIIDINIFIDPEYKRHDTLRTCTEYTQIVYDTYIDSFDAQYYTQNDVVHLSDKMTLKEITLKRILQEKRLDENDLEDLDPLLKRIDQAIDFERTDYFLKLSSNSAKHDVGIRRIRNSYDAVDYLTRSNTFLQQEYMKSEKETYAIFIPFVQINRKFEFRVFVIDKKIVGVSQQFWYEKYLYTTEECNCMIDALIAFDLRNIPYNSCVLDVYFNDGEIQVLEINPTYTSGLALFPKEYFPKFLYGIDSDTIEFRINKL